MPAIPVEPPRALSGAPDWATDGANWPHRRHSAFYRVDRHIWHIQRLGEGPPALLIHGVGAATHSWAGLMPLLATQFAVTAIDLPGHGFSRARFGFRPTLPNMSRALADLIDGLEASPSLIVGHSAGAAIAIALADRGRARPQWIVSVNGALKPFPGLMRVVAPAMAKAFSAGGLAAQALARSARDRRRVVRLLSDTGSTLPKAGIDQYAGLLRRPAHIDGALRMMANWDLSSIEGAYSRLSSEVLLLAGANDRLVPPDVAREIATRSEKASFRLMPSLGHLAHEEAPGAVGGLINAFTGAADPG